MTNDKIFWSDSLDINETMLESGIIIKNEYTVVSAVKKKNKICITLNAKLESFAKAALFDKFIDIKILENKITVKISKAKVKIENNYYIIKIKGEICNE
jgi:hypothetical protein